MSAKTLSSTPTAQAIAIPQRFTGRGPVIVHRDHIVSLEQNGSEVTLLLHGRHELILRAEEGASLDALAELLFGEDASRSRALAIHLGGRQRFNPAAICGIDHVGASVTIFLADGSKTSRPFGVDFEGFHGLVEALYGEQTSKSIVPWRKPAPSASALADERARATFERNREKRIEAETRVEAERRAEADRKARERRYGVIPITSGPAA